MVTFGTRLAFARDMNRLALLALPFALVACDVGSVPPGGDGDDEPGVDAGPGIDAAPVATLSAAVSPASASTALGSDTSFTVTVTAQHYSGTVSLAATGGLTGWQVDITPATLDFTEGGSASATVRVRIPSNGEAAPAGRPLAIAVTGGALSASATATMNVADEFTIDVGAGAATGAHWGPMAGANLRVRSGTRLHIRNNDSINHQIHTGGGIGGFDHQGGPMGPGASYDVTPTSTGADDFYCHIHGSGTGRVNLVVE